MNKFRSVIAFSFFGWFGLIAGQANGQVKNHVKGQGSVEQPQEQPSAESAESADSNESAETTEAGVGFWDPIPTNPSTTMPEKIRDGYWRGQFERVNREVAAAEETEVVFFGDSITLNWSGERSAGKEIWKEYFAKYHPINMGNSGDITPVMLYRLRKGNLAFPEGKHPKVAVLLCGTNNFVVTQSAGGEVKWELGASCPAEEVAQGVRAIAQEFRRRLPQTRLIVMGIFPVANEAKRAKCREVNECLRKVRFETEEVIFVDMWEKFMSDDGTLNSTMFSDGTHLTPEGYRLWATTIAPIIEKIVNQQKDSPQYNQS